MHNIEWSDRGMTCAERIPLKNGENTRTNRNDNFNRNMVGETNEFLIDYISL